MRALFHQALTVMGNAFQRLEQQVPPPQKQPWKDSFVFRYKEQTIEQALIQKLARSISGLHAVDMLLLHGLLQEQGVIHRTLDEIHQDIFFLAAAVTNDSVTERHKQYLASFWAEAFEDPSNPLGWGQEAQFSAAQEDQRLRNPHPFQRPKSVPRHGRRRNNQ
jgi:hypothetical protein